MAAGNGHSDSRAGEGSRLSEGKEGGDGDDGRDAKTASTSSRMKPDDEVLFLHRSS